MNSKKIVTYAIVLVLLLIVLFFWRGYNSLVSMDEKVSSAWAQVENVYQRRSDLIPNLVKTVQGSADFESTILTEVMEARASASRVQISPENLDEASMAAFEKAQAGISGALGRLMVTVERYPDLKSSSNFRELQAQLESTENRITVERKKFNEVVREYNAAVRRFPKNLIASMFGFEKKAYFQAEEGTEKAPEVSFEFGSDK